MKADAKCNYRRPGIARAIACAIVGAAMLGGCGGGGSSAPAPAAPSGGGTPTPPPPPAPPPPVPTPTPSQFVTSSPYPLAGLQPYKFLVVAPGGPIPADQQPYEVWPFINGSGQAYFGLDVTANGPWGAWNTAQLKAITVAAVGESGWLLSTFTPVGP